jgi:Fe-S-cluster-containing dehydrogenase component/CRP-like cAMP-binding protein
MPKESPSRREILNALEATPALTDLLSTHDGHFEHELDLEVCVYGRNYQGKRVGPYIRLMVFEPGETIIRQGDWGGNAFFIGTNCDLEVFIKTAAQGEIQVAPIPPGRQFGEMSVLAGVPRAATVKAPPDLQARVLQIERPALRLLRKLPHFQESLDRVYRHHGRLSAVQKMNISPWLVEEMLIEQARPLSHFRVYSKNHVLFREGTPVDSLFVVKEGWVRRTQAQGGGDFLGRGYCFGLEGARKSTTWPYTATLCGRTEVLIIPLVGLEERPELKASLVREFNVFLPPPMPDNVPASRGPSSELQERLISTGLTDATNLVVMDMGLCVRCGRCSMACHEIHGQSRLVRRGISLPPPVATRAPLLARVSPGLLAPMACMHCQDPECLTGCPTGAIARLADGQIDINTKTCIGCGDCAVNCPYSAISMVERSPRAKPALTRAAKLRELIQIRPAPLPRAVETTEELVASKCNLCRGTTLNPPKSETAVYGCEENCPTGALARVNPREYFQELGGIEGPAYKQPSSTEIADIHRDDPTKRRIHMAGILLTALAAVAAAIGIEEYGFNGRLAGFTTMRWLTGLAGLLCIAGAMAYPRRRQIFRFRAGALRYWMLVHTYFGIAGALLILLHTGRRSGGLLTTALVVSFDIVIASGLWGIFCYRIIPRWLVSLEEGNALLADDIDLRREELKKEISESLRMNDLESAREFQRTLARLSSTGFLLRQFIRREPMQTLFTEALNSSPGAEFGPVEALVALRRLDALHILHVLMKSWLPPHAAATAVMLALLVVHLLQVAYGIR